MIKSSLPIQDTARAEFCSEYLLLNYLGLKRKCKEKISLVLLPPNQPAGVWDWHEIHHMGKLFPIMMEMHLSLKHLKLACVRDRILAWTDSGSDTGWQLFCSAVKCLCTKESLWDKQVSSGNAVPPAKVILHFDEVHDSISVLQTCFFPTEYDVFFQIFSNSACLDRKIPRDLSKFKAAWNQNTLGRDLLTQDDVSCKGRQLFFMPPQTLRSREIVIS